MSAENLCKQELVGRAMRRTQSEEDRRTDEGDRCRRKGKSQRKGLLASLWDDLRAEWEESGSFSVLSHYMPLYHLQNFQRWQKEVTGRFYEGNAANPIAWPPTEQNETNKKPHTHKKNNPTLATLIQRVVSL